MLYVHTGKEKIMMTFNKKIVIISVISIFALAGIIIQIKDMIEFPFWKFFKDANYEFSKEAVQVVVPLIEMHKLREGKYPNKLADIKYLGMYGEGQIHYVKYKVNKDYTKYYIKAKADMPKEFWLGTGYSLELK